MKNIVICIPSLEFGGAERVTVRLADELSKYYNVTIITTHISINEYECPLKVDRISLNSDSFCKNIRRCRQIIKKMNPEFVIVMFAPMYIFIYLSLLGLNIPQIVSERNDPSHFAGRKIIKLLYQYVLTKADGCVFQTKQARDYYLKKSNIENTIIYNPISKRDLPEYFEGIREKRIVSVGRLHQQKNQLLLIDAMIEIHNRIPDYKLVIYGEGEMREQLEDHIQKNHAQNYIELFGKSDIVLSLINNASLFVLTSNFEGMPNALIEAMCMGLPVISTNCPCDGPAELIDDGINGMLVEVGNKNQLSQTILKVLENPQLSKMLGKNSKNLINILNIEIIAKQWLDFCYRIKENKSK